MQCLMKNMKIEKVWNRSGMHYVREMARAGQKDRNIIDCVFFGFFCDKWTLTEMYEACVSVQTATPRFSAADVCVHAPSRLRDDAGHSVDMGPTFHATRCSR